LKRDKKGIKPENESALGPTMGEFFFQKGEKNGLETSEKSKP
jgi:hypothetical protein